MAIKKDMTIGEVVRQYPQTVSALMSFGMGCIGCPSAQSETLAEAAMVHRIDVDALVEKLNKAI